MDKYKEAYREEAYELLSELETSLLELEESPDNQELIGRIFRTLHTIKGSGAMFGFEDIAEFTHEVEAVFEQVRDGKIPVTKALIDPALSAGDHIRGMLDGQKKTDASVSDKIISAFRAFFPEKEFAEPEPELLRAPSHSESPNVTYRIRFQPDIDIFYDGTNPIRLLDEIRELGDASIVARTDAIPRLADFDPEACYIYWDIILTTSEGMNAIKDVFIFVEGKSEINIEAIDRQDKSEDETDYENVTDTGMTESGPAKQEHIKKMGVAQSIFAPSLSIRVPAERLDSLVDLVGELVTVQAHLSQKASLQKDPELLSIAEEVERLIAELRDNTMRIRMLPIGATFNKFKRMIRDLSKELGKEVVMTTEGGETELDKTVIEQLDDPLLHILRNTIDHGIERPEVRVAMGKPREGKISLSAEHSGAHVLIRISGDGSGIDSEAIRSKAVEKGIISSDAALNEKEIFSLIFAPGFSTAKSISGVSGRGVGLDVVKQTIESLRGTVEVRSKKDKGTTTTLKLPLTLAIIDGLLVKIGESHFVLPLSSVEECVELIDDALIRARRRNIMTFRGEMIPYLNLREIFMTNGEPPSLEQVIVAETNDIRVGFGVDRVVGQHQTVIKTLGKIYRDIEGISGATIMGDGTVALILDAPKLVQSLKDNEDIFRS